MSRDKYLAVCVQAFTHVVPESILENLDITLPEKRFEYAVGAEVAFGTKRALKDFVRFHVGKFAARVQP
jgi:hypothetical protein